MRTVRLFGVALVGMAGLASCGLPGGGLPPAISVSDASGDQCAPSGGGNCGEINAVFTVTLSHASDETVEVDYTTTPGTASESPIPSAYYNDATGTLSFAPGETEKTITVQVNDRSFLSCDADATFTLNLSNADNGVIFDGQGVGTIHDSFDCSL